MTDTKVLQLFVHVQVENYRTLFAKYQDDAALKFFLSRTLTRAIEKECEEIKKELLENILTIEPKL